LAPSVREIVNGFPSFSVVSCHLAFTLFAFSSLTVLSGYSPDRSAAPSAPPLCTR
jgi:hypothetical protein